MRGRECIDSDSGVKLLFHCWIPSNELASSGVWAGLTASTTPPLWHQSKVTAASFPDPFVISGISAAAAERGRQPARHSSFYYPVPPPPHPLCAEAQGQRWKDETEEELSAAAAQARRDYG